MIRLTTIVENTATGTGLRAEHGLSVLVETETDCLLFDTGQTDCLIHNAKVLGVDLSRIEKVVLSHGHYDHTGGLTYLCDYATSPIVYAHPEIFRQRYVKSGDNLRYIGMEKRALYEEHGARFVLSDRPAEVIKGVYTTGLEEMTTDFEEVDKGFVYKTGTEYKKDDVPDDMSLVLDTRKGLFVLFGCAHRGIINIIRQVEKEFEKKVFGFIGGTHLGPASEILKRRTMEELKGMNLEVIGPSHCTGASMTERFQDEFDNKIVSSNAGAIIELD